MNTNILGDKISQENHEIIFWKLLKDPPFNLRQEENDLETWLKAAPYYITKGLL